MHRAAVVIPSTFPLCKRLHGSQLRRRECQQSVLREDEGRRTLDETTGKPFELLAGLYEQTPIRHLDGHLLSSVSGPDVQTGVLGERDCSGQQSRRGGFKR
jgi:hypothetical protein